MQLFRGRNRREHHIFNDGGSATTTSIENEYIESLVFSFYKVRMVVIK